MSPLGIVECTLRWGVLSAPPLGVLNRVPCTEPCCHSWRGCRNAGTIAFMDVTLSLDWQ